MNNKIDPCDTMRNNLIAAAVGLQQCTKTASNLVPIPGGDRVIAIGTPAQVTQLLADAAHIVAFGASLLGYASETDALDADEALTWVRKRWAEWSSQPPAPMYHAPAGLLAEILALAESGMCHGLVADDYCSQIVAKIKAAPDAAHADDEVRHGR